MFDLQIMYTTLNLNPHCFVRQRSTVLRVSLQSTVFRTIRI